MVTAPEHALLLWNMYCKETKLYTDNGEVIKSDRGMIQGCPASSGSYSICAEAQYKLLQPCGLAATIFFFDDTALVDGDALGIVETSTAVSAIIAADAGVKAADVALLTIRLSDDLGGKAYCLFAGTVADVEAAIERAVEASEQRGKLVGTAVIPQLHHEMRDNLAAELRFNHHLRRRNGTS